MQHPTFLEALQQVSSVGKQEERVEIRKILSILSRRGTEALLVIFSVPIPIPGLSNLFGVILAFLGFQFASGNGLWLPKWILNRTISGAHLHQFAEKVIRGVRSLEKVLYPRLPIFIHNPIFKKVTAILICLLAFIVALPIPIPMTNILFATPILIMSLGLLEDDGLFVLLGYSLFVLDALILLGIYHLLT